MSKRLLLIIASALAIAGLVAVFLFFKDSPSSTNETVKSEIVSVCDESIVDKYNGATLYSIRQEGSEASIDKTGIDSLLVSIKSISGYQDDPTCQTILFWEAIRIDDYDSALSAYESISAQHDKGIFAKDNIRGDQSFSDYQRYLDSLSNSPAALLKKDQYVED